MLDVAYRRLPRGIGRQVDPGPKLEIWPGYRPSETGIPEGVVPFSLAVSSQFSAAASPGGVVHGVVRMKGMLDTTAFARRVTNPGAV